MVRGKRSGYIGSRVAAALLVMALLALWRPVQAASAAGIRSGPDGGDFAISMRGLGDQLWPVTAWNSDDDEFLVVWSEATEYAEIGYVTTSHIHGQIFSAQGVPQGDSFDISTTEGEKSHFSVVYNPNAAEYLVVWKNLRYGTYNRYEIHAQRVSADGVLLDNPTTPENEALPDESLEITYVTIWDTFNGVAAAYNSRADEYLVTWDEERHGYKIRGQFVAANGSLVGNTLEIHRHPTEPLSLSGIAYNVIQDE